MESLMNEWSLTSSIDFQHHHHLHRNHCEKISNESNCGCYSSTKREKQEEVCNRELSVFVCC